MCMYTQSHTQDRLCVHVYINPYTGKTMCVHVCTTPPHRTGYDSIIKTSLTCFYFCDTINWFPGPLWAAVKCGYQAGAICEDAISTVWAAGRDTATQAALCHQLQLCHLSLLHHSNTLADTRALCFIHFPH